MLPLPGSPASSWAMYRARLREIFQGADIRVCAAFWLFGMHLLWLLAAMERLNTYRSRKQRALCHHPLCCPRSRRSLSTQGRCPPLRCHPLFPHEITRAILHPGNTLPYSRHIAVYLVSLGDAPHCVDACVHGWWHHIDENGGRSVGQSELWGWGIELRKLDTLLRSLQFGRMGKRYWRCRLGRCRSVCFSHDIHRLKQ